MSASSAAAGAALRPPLSRPPRQGEPLTAKAIQGEFSPPNTTAAGRFSMLWFAWYENPVQSQARH